MGLQCPEFLTWKVGNPSKSPFLENWGDLEVGVVNLV